MRFQSGSWFIKSYWDSRTAFKLSVDSCIPHEEASKFPNIFADRDLTFAPKFPFLANSGYASSERPHQISFWMVSNSAATEVCDFIFGLNGAPWAYMPFLLHFKTLKTSGRMFQDNFSPSVLSPSSGLSSIAGAPGSLALSCIKVRDIFSRTSSRLKIGIACWS